MRPLFRPAGTFSPTIDLCRPFPTRLWGRRVAAGWSTAMEKMAVKTPYGRRPQTGFPTRTGFGKPRHPNPSKNPRRFSRTPRRPRGSHILHVAR